MGAHRAYTVNSRSCIMSAFRTRLAAGLMSFFFSQRARSSATFILLKSLDDNAVGAAGCVSELAKKAKSFSHAFSYTSSFT